MSGQGAHQTFCITSCPLFSRGFLGERDEPRMPAGGSAGIGGRDRTEKMSARRSGRISGVDRPDIGHKKRIVKKKVKE